MARFVDGKIILEIGDEAVIDVLRDVAANNAARKKDQAQAVARPDPRADETASPPLPPET